MARINYSKIINSYLEEKPLNKVFLDSLMKSIEIIDSEPKTVSNTYKPSAMNCVRRMYYMRIGQPTEPINKNYMSIGMADTGTRRHEAIQEVLLKMNEMNNDWQYIDVGEYVRESQLSNKLPKDDLEIVEKIGAETKLYSNRYNMSFRCDGLLRYKPTNKVILFEFKNQKSTKFRDKKCNDKEHITQVVAYATALGVDDVFILYENRDTCELNIPEYFVVTKDMKLAFSELINLCEYNYNNGILPCRQQSLLCSYCEYINACGKAGE